MVTCRIGLSITKHEAIPANIGSFLSPAGSLSPRPRRVTPERLYWRHQQGLEQVQRVDQGYIIPPAKGYGYRCLFPIVYIHSYEPGRNGIPLLQSLPIMETPKAGCFGAASELANTNVKTSVTRTDELSPVDWNGPDDPENPLNWIAFKKWLATTVIAYITFVT